MPFLIYSVVGLGIFKVLVDAIGGNVISSYSVLLEALLFGFFLAIILRTSVRQKEARRENLEEDIRHLREQLEESKGS